jgi:hypothetical protein
MDTIWIILILQSIIFGFFSSFIASEKNRDSISWFILGFLFSIVAVLALVAIPKVEQKPTGSQIMDLSKTVCPFCKEEILPDAILCKHCRSDLSETQPITISTQVKKVMLENKVKKIVCPKCKFTEEVSPNDSFHKFKTHQGYRWEQSCLICPKCQKKIYI